MSRSVGPIDCRIPWRDNGPAFNGRPGARPLSNHKDRSARPARCSAWLSRPPGPLGILRGPPALLVYFQLREEIRSRKGRVRQFASVPLYVRDEQLVVRFFADQLEELGVEPAPGVASIFPRQAGEQRI